MRTMLTKRLLKEGLLRILEKETLSKISISELCEKSGINRGTFYKHYESPATILRDIAYDYDRQMSIIYETTQCMLVRLLGIVDLVALPILVYSTIKKVKMD